MTNTNNQQQVAMNNATTYEVNVTPKGFQGILPTYDVNIYIYRRAGVCEPGIEEEVVGLDGIDRWLDENGYVRTSSYGPVCTNGFASAEVERKNEDIFGLLGRIHQPTGNTI